jgi:hypothetical protein
VGGEGAGECECVVVVVGEVRDVGSSDVNTRTQCGTALVLLYYSAAPTRGSLGGVAYTA